MSFFVGLPSWSQSWIIAQNVKEKQSDMHSPISAVSVTKGQSLEDSVSTVADLALQSYGNEIQRASSPTKLSLELGDDGQPPKTRSMWVQNILPRPCLPNSDNSSKFKLGSPPDSPRNPILKDYAWKRV